ncbi:hypothetical protein ZWY2020_021532 [Hordeum vulgare]|nr:hypothetical protein ZWY2020_021532 [Hordeum vulgare]
MDDECILTSELSFGSKKVMKNECEIKQDGTPGCGCKLRPVIRICNEGFDSVDNKKLQIALFQKEQEIQRMKNKRNKLVEQRKSRKRKDMFLVVVASVVTCVAFALLSRVIVLS